MQTGELAVNLEGRKSTGEGKRACCGVWLSDHLVIAASGEVAPINYPGKLGRACWRRIRLTANARTETFERPVKVSFSCMAAVGGGRSDCIVNKDWYDNLLVCCKFGLCPTGSRTFVLFSFSF